VGLESVVEGSETIDAVCIRALKENVYLLPWVPRADSRDSRPRLQMATALTSMAQQFDLVLVDAGPISKETGALGQDTEELLEMAAMIVQDARITTREELQSVAARLHEARLRMAGIIENFAA
jgi:Mrp family chromosome partitioning ATPase